MKLRNLAFSAMFLAACNLSASIITYTVNLSGPNESPANASPGIGTGLVTFDDIANTLRVQVTFSGLLGTTTASHIHCCTTAPFTGTAGVATQTPSFSGFPLGVTSGFFDGTFDLTQLSTYNAPFVAANGGTAAGAEAALIAGAAAGKEYLNIHTTVVPGGEIRGFLVPEPATVGLVGLALMGLLGLRRRFSA